MRYPAVILAGGRSSRLGGGDKCLLPMGGTSILARIIAVLSPQAGPIAINSNSDPARFCETGLPVIADSVPGRPGPLAGILTALRWAEAIGCGDVVTVSCDTPFLPDDLVARLEARREKGGVAVAASGGTLHPTACVWPVHHAARLERDLSMGIRRVGAWLATLPHAVEDFAAAPVDPFWNVNTRDDWLKALDLNESVSP